MKISLLILALFLLAADQVYVANFAGHGISVVEGTQTVRTIPVLNRSPLDLAFVGTRAYVTAPYSREVLEMDVASGKILDVISWESGPNAPCRILADADGTTVYVGHRAVPQGWVSIIDTTTNSSTDIEVGGAADYMVALDGFLFVACSWVDAVDVVDLATLEVSTIPVGHYPEGMCTDGNGKLYVCNAGGNSISVIDAATQTPDSKFHLHNPSACACWGKTLWVVQANPATISAVDLITKMILEYPLPGQHSIFDMAITPDGAGIYLTDLWTNEVVLFDTNNGGFQVLRGFQEPNGIHIQ
jgi:DNA-binding beta-propeller fold protein YncE